MKDLHPISREKIKWNPRLYREKHSYVFKYGADVLSLLDPCPGEKILDVGCGTGELTHLIKLKGSHVTGIDKSQDMISEARASFPSTSFVYSDILAYKPSGYFDALISNAVLHWIPNQEEVLAVLFSLLRPGGRFIFEMGGCRNLDKFIDAISVELLKSGVSEKAEDYNFFPSLGYQRKLLEKTGFLITYATFFSRKTVLSSDEQGIIDWIVMFRKHMIDRVPDEKKDLVLRNVLKRLRKTNFENGNWFADYKRIRMRVFKPMI